LEQAVAERTTDILKLGEIGKELTNTLHLELALDRVYRQVSARLDAHVFLVGSYLAELAIIRVDYAVEGGAKVAAFEFAMSERERPAVWCVRERRELITANSQQLLDYVTAVLPSRSSIFR
jgi:hypothetical protein